MQRHELGARFPVVVLRKKDYSQSALEARLGWATSSTQELVPLVTQLFEQPYCPDPDIGRLWWVGRLESDRERQGELFEDNLRIEKQECTSTAIAAANRRLGKRKRNLGAGLFLAQRQKSGREIVSL